MKNSVRRTLGVISFVLSGILFAFLYFNKQEKADFRKKTIEIISIRLNHLNNDRKCKCVSILSQIENALLDNKSVNNLINHFNETCFILPDLDIEYSKDYLLENFIKDDWIDNDGNNFLFNWIVYFLYPERIIRENQNAIMYRLLQNSDFDRLHEMFENTPSMFLTCDAKKFKKELSIFIENILILRQASTKIYH